MYSGATISSYTLEQGRRRTGGAWHKKKISQAPNYAPFNFARHSASGEGYSERWTEKETGRRTGEREEERETEREREGRGGNTVSGWRTVSGYCHSWPRIFLFKYVFSTWLGMCSRRRWSTLFVAFFFFFFVRCSHHANVACTIPQKNAVS